MIKHVVMYKLKDNSIENRIRTKEVLMSMVGKIDLFNSIEVGIDCLGSERSFDVILTMTFDSLEKMNDYKVHEYHKNIVQKYMHEAREKSVSVDYEI